MIYHAKISIDDDRWSKHPYSVKIYDENDNIVVNQNYLDDEEECLNIISNFKDQGNDVSDDIETDYY